MKYLILLLSLTCLISCKVSIETQIDISELTDGKNNEINSDLYVEVPTCNNFEDSRKPSDSLIDAVQTVESTIKESKFVECFNKEFESFAHFKMPIAIDRIRDGKIASDDNIILLSNESILLGAQIPPNLKNRIQKMESNSLGMHKLDNVKFKIKITNKNKKQFNYGAYSVFIDGVPNVANKFTNNGDSFEIILSDVSFNQAFNGRVSPILFLLD